MSKLLEYNATLVAREDLEPTLAIFRLKPDDETRPEGQWFVPGQYMTIGYNREVKEGEEDPHHQSTPHHHPPELQRSGKETAQG